MHEPVSRRSLTQEVLRTLGRRIADRNLKDGDRLPTERALAAELGVSRSTVREALRSLEAIGALARRPKRGCVLAPIDFGLLAEISQTLLLRSAADLAELLAARRLLEIGVLPLVAQRATTDDYAAMEAANARIEAEVAAGWLPVDGDLAFHAALLRASHNRFLVQFGTLLEEFFRAVRQRVVADERANRRTLREHRTLVGALREGDVRRAQRVMERHLEPQRHARGRKPANAATGVRVRQRVAIAAKKKPKKRPS